MQEKNAHIRILSDQVINKIAAGEVVERPASVVKELMENALDAQSTNIDVEIVSGGKTLTAVSDNGVGMDRNDAILSIERHATSKINEVDDIERVATLGFRGEALAAISSVSRFTLRTRPGNALSGTELVMAGGKVESVRDAGCPPGTQIEVRHLFFNVPARRKFLRSEQTETAHIRQVFMTQALANPTCGMTLKADGRPVYNLPRGAAIEDRLNDLFVSIPTKDLRPVMASFGELRISGYAALPSLTRADRSEQYLFINRRPASGALLAGAIREAYQALIPKERYPIVFLFIEIDPSLVDVNVHPAKKEVRFRNPGEIRNAVAEAVRLALANPSRKNIPFSSARPSPGGPSPAPVQARFTAGMAAGKEPPAAADHMDYFHARKNIPARVAPEMAPAADPGHGKTNTSPGSSAETGSRPWAWFRILGQVGNLYVIMETEDGVVVMDPHAAHERVLFEKFINQINSEAVNSQALLMAEHVALSPSDAIALRHMMDSLKKAGFGIAEFGQDTFLVDAVPACLGDVSARQLIEEMAAALNEFGPGSKGARLPEEQIAKSACHAAVKARSRLTTEEIERLVVELEKAEMPYTCPHGRPIIIHFSFQELAKKFGRSAPRGESDDSARDGRAIHPGQV